MAVVLSPVMPDEVDLVQDLIESDPAYSERVMGSPPGPAEAQSLLMARPPDIPAGNKEVLGVRRGEELVGLVDLVRGYPESGVVYIGLLQIRKDLQGQGLGRAAHGAVTARVKDWLEVRRLRLAVLGTNRQVEPFWLALGYLPIGEPIPYRYDKVVTTAQRYELFIGDTVP